MPAQPIGDIPPLTGALPAGVAQGSAQRTWSAYVHVPYCRVRCGYCDFNTYTSTDLGPGANREDFRAGIAAEMDLAAGVLNRAGVARRPLDTVFFGGGTPTLLAAEVLAGVLQNLQERWPLAAGAEVTTEANPDTLTPAYIDTLAAAGFTRISLGMQSAVPHVLETLDRTHDPRRIPEVVQWIKAAGLQVSLDLIYGTPGESLEDWRRSVEVALANEPDHISAYSLIVEPGTKMGSQVRRGELPMPDEDDLADKYELADALFAAAGLHWYEVSNFSTGPDTRCRHNLAYWQEGDWWGFGAGAHSHVGGTRFWNAKHPRAWAARLAAGQSPAVGREVLGPDTREVERIMLAARIEHGLRRDSLPDGATAYLNRFERMGLLEDDPIWFAPTVSGRLMADYMVRELSDLLI
ncbi:radical SAM family heme chaperone HemW [Brevibacterium sp. 50QC2O2]|uniref:radical SAM family heme chaperone HemW n=1 Tax=Brevibacterium TaxID=1696 RepID=UPI00211D1050|nr:radical SAM family heme chaperone HemW [Brevibacterium sp. 68QC2CO]MCQ9388438.1 radical SAM family heme chaperone HemW [Brevibacterium sp. 50QC2O2]